MTGATQPVLPYNQAPYQNQLSKPNYEWKMSTTDTPSQSRPPHAPSPSSSRSSSPQEQPHTRPPPPSSSDSITNDKSKRPQIPLRPISGSAAPKNVPRIMTRAPTAVGSRDGKWFDGKRSGSGRLAAGDATGGEEGGEGRMDGDRSDHLRIMSGVDAGGQQDDGRLSPERGAWKTKREKRRDDLGILHGESIHRSSSRSLSHQPPSSLPLPFADIDQANPNSAFRETSHSNEGLSIPHPPSFAPFFTLINDLSLVSEGGMGAGVEGQTYHPRRVRYLFSDDDVGELVAAAAKCAGAGQDDEGGDGEEGEDIAENEKDISLKQSATTGSSSEMSASTFKGAPQLGESRGKGKGRRKLRAKPEERVVLIDIAASGENISRAVSLSRSWQIVNAEVGMAPMWGGAATGEEGMEGKRRSRVEEGEGRGSGFGGGGGGGEAGEKKGLMVRIEGVGRKWGAETSDREERNGRRVKRRNEEENGNSNEDADEDKDEDDDVDTDVMEEELTDEQMRDLLDGLAREMAVLRRVVEHDKWRDGEADGIGNGGVEEVGGVDDGRERDEEGG